MTGRRIIVPVSDVNQGNFTHTPGSPNTLFDHIDEPLADDSDFVVSIIGSPQSDLFEVALTEQQQPEQGSPTSDNEGGHEVRYRLGKDASDTALNVTVFLLQSGLDESPSHIVAQWTHYDIPQAAKTYTRGLTQAEAQSITDYTDLRLRFEVEEDPTSKMFINFALDSLQAGSPTTATDIDDAIVRGPASLTFTRASDAFVVDETGIMVQVTDDNARFDHDPGTQLKDLSYDASGILIEGAATNVILRSETLDHADWATSAVVTADDAVAPDGNTTADKVDDSSAGVIRSLQQAVTVTDDSTSWCFSIFVKKTSSDTHYLSIDPELTGGTALADVRVVLDTNTGEITATEADVADSGVIDAGDYWRLWIVNTNNGTGNTTLNTKIVPALNTDGTATGAAAATGVKHLWGAQVENTAYPTSYIATTTTSVTRATEVCRATDLSWFNSDWSGSWVTEASFAGGTVNGLGGTRRHYWSIDDDAGDILKFRTESNDAAFEITEAGASTALNIESSITGTTLGESSVKYGAAIATTNDAEIYINGVSDGTDTSHTLPTGTFADLRIGTDQSGVALLYGHIKSIRYWSVRKPDAFMEALTSSIDEPTMHLDFALNTPSGSPGDVPSIDDAIIRGPASLTFTRASHRKVWDENGTLVELDNNVPGYDHCPTGEPLGILIEGAATNVCLQSEDFTTLWSSSGSIVKTADDAVAPDGNTTADKLDDQSGAASGFSQQNITIADDSTSWCFSVFIKKTTGESHYVRLVNWLRLGTQQIGQIICNTNDGTISASAVVSASGVIDAGDYWRFWAVTDNNGTGNTQARVSVYPAYNTDGTTTQDVTATGFKHFWGAQLENTAYPTSYISTTTAAVTRAVDVLDDASTNWANIDFTGSWVLEIKNATISAGIQDGVFGLEDNAAGGELILSVDASDNIVLAAQGETGTLSISSASWPADATLTKIGIACALTNDAELYQDGASVGTDSSYTLGMSPPPVKLELGRNSTFGGPRNYHLKNIRYWPRRLNDTEMIALTNNG